MVYARYMVYKPTNITSRAPPGHKKENMAVELSNLAPKDRPQRP